MRVAFPSLQNLEKEQVVTALRILVLLVCMVARLANAQSGASDPGQTKGSASQPRPVYIDITGLSSAETASRIRDALFAGIVLSDSQAHRALLIVEEQERAYAALRARGGASVGLHDVAELEGRRNAELVALLSSPADRTKFFENSDRRMVIYWKVSPRRRGPPRRNIDHW